MATLLRFSGCITALATPFEASGALDLAAWRTLLEAQLAGGVDGVVVAGSTGEAAMLEAGEFETLIGTAVEILGGRLPVLAGAGLSGTAATIRQCLRARAAGAHALLVAAPAYVRPTQEGMQRHFEAVAEALDAPVVLYNVPSRTAVDLEPGTVARLAHDPRIAGIKEALPDVDRMAALLRLRSPTFAVLGGDDGSARAAQLAGADGVVSVASNLVPAACTRLSALARAGTADEALALDTELAPLYQVLALEPNPIPLKAVLAELGLCGDRLRLPLLPLSSPHRTAAVAAARAARALEARFFPQGVRQDARPAP